MDIKKELMILCIRYHEMFVSESALRACKEPDNPQHGNPYSVVRSAEIELMRRGYTQQEINRMSL